MNSVKVKIMLRRGKRDYHVEQITGAVTIMAVDEKDGPIELRIGEFIGEEVAKQLAASPTYEVTVKAKK